MAMPTYPDQRREYDASLMMLVIVSRARATSRTHVDDFTLVVVFRAANAE
jgi:hypothetical protein